MMGRLSSTSAIRSRVPVVVSGGSLPASKKAAGDDLAVRLRHPVLAKLVDHIDRDMVAAGDMAVEEHAEQSGFANKLDSALFHQFALQRVAKCFADLDAAARQMPAGHITVLDQKDAIVSIQHHGANAQRHAPGKSPIQVKDPPQRRLEPLPKCLQAHDGSDFEVPGMFEIPALFETADLAVGPCVTSAILPKHAGHSQRGIFTE